MNLIERPNYLQKMIDRKNNGMVKILTGIRRCGKSFLLDPIFKNYLLANGIKEDHIIKLDLDELENEKYLDPYKLNDYVKSKVTDSDTYYVLLDEIQKVDKFEALLNGFLHKGNLDVYVTGSNSKFLSSDVITEFRGRGDEIRVFPLSFAEYCSAYEGDKHAAYEEYIRYGGMPSILSRKTDEAKSAYLSSLFELTYVKDIIERNKINRNDVLDAILNMLASSIGSLTNPQKLYDTFKSKGYGDVSKNTIINYLDYISNSFLIEKASRYDIKGKRYIDTPQKYYYADVGLRNSRLNYRQNEENHIMENIIFNELLQRGYNVDVGLVNVKGDKRRQYEVDFVCNKGNRKMYVQSSLRIDDEEKREQETRPLNYIDDSFSKIIIVKDDLKPWQDEKGVLTMGILDFLLKPDFLPF